MQIIILLFYLQLYYIHIIHNNVAVTKRTQFEYLHIASRNVIAI